MKKYFVIGVIYEAYNYIEPKYAFDDLESLMAYVKEKEESIKFVTKVDGDGKVFEWYNGWSPTHVIDPIKKTIEPYFHIFEMYISEQTRYLYEFPNE